MSKLGLVPVEVGEDELNQTIDGLVELVELVCSCGDPTHARHQVRSRVDASARDADAR